MKISTIILIAVAIILIAIYLYNKGALSSAQNSNSLASCIKKSGAKFYGAYWCGHCNSQKDMFGKDKDKLPYIECTGPGGKGLSKACQDANLTAFPTWVFSNGKTVVGELSLDQLKKETGC